MNQSSLKGKNVLVTGASGFIGSHLCRNLIALGARVHGVSRSERGRQVDSIVWWQGDVADHEVIKRIFADVQPEYVFHLASEVTGSRDRQFVLPALHSNLLSTVQLLNLAVEYRCQRIVLAGSLEEPQHNNAPASPYAAAKAASSLYAQMFFNLYQTPVVTARLFMVYGPEQRDTTKLIPYVTLSLLRGDTPQLSSGTRPVDWIYVDDVVDGLLKCAVTPGIEGKTVELGSGKLVTVRHVVEMLADIISPGAVIAFDALPDRPFEQVRTACTAESLALINWQAQISLADGLRRTVDSYR